MPFIKDLNKKQVLSIFKKIQKSELELPDNSILKVKVKPSFLNMKKTRVVLEWNKSVDNVDFSILVDGQPVRISSEGIHSDSEDYFRIVGKATMKF